MGIYPWVSNDLGEGTMSDEGFDAYWIDSS